MSGGEKKVSKAEALEGTAEERPVALVVGDTGIVGNHLVKRLLAGEKNHWQKVYGVSRKPLPEWMQPVDPRYTHIQCDVANEDDVLVNLGPIIGVTHLFWATWTMKGTEEENCEANGAMFKNVLSILGSRAAGLRHVALTTGTKHYLGPFELYGKIPVQIPFKEDMPRLPHPNFYYTLEDILVSFSGLHNFTWTVHRPFTIIGFAPGNLMNLGTSLAVYASICKYTGEALLFPGSKEQWEGRNDVSDADIVAKHEIWAATEPKAANEAYNVTNCDVFRWKDLWGKIAAFYGLKEAPYPGEPSPLQERMKDKGPVWDQIVKEHGLKPYKMEDIAIWWHTDADLSRPFEAYNDMSKSRERGFTETYDSFESFFNLFKKLREEKYTL